MAKGLWLGNALTVRHRPEAVARQGAVDPAHPRRPRDAEAGRECAPIDYPKPDGVLTFDRLSSVFLSNTNHEEDQPCHLTLKDADGADPTQPGALRRPGAALLPGRRVRDRAQRDGGKRLQINAQNCVHCKTCDIKDPTQNINWVVPRAAKGRTTPAGADRDARRAYDDRRAARIAARTKRVFAFA
jgi:electron-transferring-flavoprotein dehydrogenase